MSGRGLRLRTALRRFGRSCLRFALDERGSASVDFVLWLPVIVYIIVGMFSISFYLSTAAEVQQVAHEVARAGISRMAFDGSQAEICTELETEVLPRIAQSMLLVRAERFAPFQPGDCTRDADDFFTIRVTYRLENSPLYQLGRTIGFTMTELRRKAMVQL